LSGHRPTKNLLPRKSHIQESNVTRVSLNASAAWSAVTNGPTTPHLGYRFDNEEGDQGLVIKKERKLIHIDHARLVQLARSADVHLAVLPALGDFVPAGAPLVRIDGQPSTDIASDTLRRVTLDTERSMAQDLAYGPRLLVDICVRSLSDPFDPTTGVQAIDRLYDFLRRLVHRHLPNGEHRDDYGTLRLTTKTASWDDYVRLSSEEIRNSVTNSVQTTRRLRACLEDLLQCGPVKRRAPLERQLEAARCND